MPNLLDSLNIAASGLNAESLRLHTIASNMANARTTRSEDGSGPYQRQVPVFSSEALDPFGDALERATSRVEVTEIVTDARPPVRVYDPGHPDADSEGYVSYPDINILQEMVDMMTTNRSYEANANVVDSTRSMALTALNIGK